MSYYEPKFLTGTSHWLGDRWSFRNFKNFKSYINGKYGLIPDEIYMNYGERLVIIVPTESYGLNTNTHYRIAEIDTDSLKKIEDMVEEYVIKVKPRRNI